LNAKQIPWPWASLEKNKSTGNENKIKIRKCLRSQTFFKCCPQIRFDWQRMPQFIFRTPAAERTAACASRKKATQKIKS
jgi:hypothetical protein